MENVIIYLKKISNYIGSNNNVSIINGTSALHLMMKMLGIGKNDEVLVQSLTYISSINSIIYNNAIPHFIEIDKNNLNVDVEKLDNYLKRITYQKNNLCYNKKTKKIRYFLSVCINDFQQTFRITKILKNII